MSQPVLGKGKPTHIPGADEMVHGKGSFYKNKQPNITELLGQYDELAISKNEEGSGASSPAASSKPSMSTMSMSMSSSFVLDESEDTLGRSRSSMKKNYLIQRQHPRIGSVPPPTVAPVQPEKTYGRKNDFADGGVPALINGLDESKIADKKKKNKQRSKSQETPRQLNYLEMNKRSVQHGLVNAKEQFRLRDAVQVEKPVTIGKPRPRADAPKDGRVFGAPSQHDFSLPALLSHEYQRQWTEKQLERSRSEVDLMTKKPLKTGTTRATMLRQKTLEPEQPQALWKMSKYEQVAPIVSSFRDASFRERAFESHKSDGVARSGEQQQGIYIQ